MHDVSLVKVLERERHLGHVEARHALVKEAVDGDEGLEVAAHQVLHDEKHVVHRLEAVEETHAERRLCDGERVSLGHHLRRHVLLHHLRLTHHLDGVQGTRVKLSKSENKKG